MLAAQAITVQVALLYTNALGERRIRVHTVLLPVVQVDYIILIFKRRAPLKFHFGRYCGSLLSSIFFYLLFLHAPPRIYYLSSPPLPLPFLPPPPSLPVPVSSDPTYLSSVFTL